MLQSQFKKPTKRERIADQEAAKAGTLPIKHVPKWKVMGFKNKAAMKAFENRPDFPGWDAL